MAGQKRNKSDRSFERNERVKDAGSDPAAFLFGSNLVFLDKATPGQLVLYMGDAQFVLASSLRFFMSLLVITSNNRLET